VTRALRGLVHLAALLGLAAWALALGRFLRDPSVAGGIGVALVLALVLLAIRRLYRPEGLLRRPSSNLKGVTPALGVVKPGGGLSPNVEGLSPNVEGLSPNVEGQTPPLFEHGVDLNSAGVEELVTLPGVGPVAARRIVDEREAGGPFASVEALTRVPGFGPAKVRALADRVRV
jgi:competence protein ComEA